jgi:hypothetical protein
MSSIGSGAALSNFEEGLSPSRPSNFQEAPPSMQTHEDTDDYDEGKDDYDEGKDDYREDEDHYPYAKTRDTELPCCFFAPGIFPTTNVS